MRQYVVIIGLLCCNVCFSQAAPAQTIYVDPNTGNDDFAGTKEKPVMTIVKAIALTRRFNGSQPISIKLFPGLHLLTTAVIIDSLPMADDTAGFRIEAVTLPTDTAWRPALMPVIQSISDNNINYGNFNHCAGFRVERSNTRFAGLKFTGNPHPLVQYYYPIERHKPTLHTMDIRYCLFVGAGYAAPLQGAVFSQGPGISIDHCTFYNCKNAVLCFTNTRGFSLTHSIICGAQEAGVRLGYGADGDLPFIFHHNIIANCGYAWLGYKTTHHYYQFEDAVFTGNNHYIGYNTDPEQTDSTSKVTEQRVLHEGIVQFSPDLELLPTAAGYHLQAGYH